MLTLILGYAVVFLARVVDVSMMTLRTLMLMRGNKLMAAFFGFFEVLVYISALKFIFDTLSDTTSLIIYALGFSAGNIVGIWIEEKLALGFLTMQVITMDDGISFSKLLREQGFGVTLFPCHGQQGCHNVLNIVFERKRTRELENIVRNFDPNAFITITDTRTIRGGHFRSTRK